MDSKTNFILTICLGWTGYARFRKGQIGLGILWLCTFGCFYVGWIVDIVEAYKEYKGTSVGNIAPNVSAASTPSAPVPSFGKSVLWTVDKSIMGSTYPNPDGSDRQAIIKKLKVGEPITFMPAPIKDYPDLIGAFTKKGKQIGSVPYDVVNIIKDNYAGYPMSAQVKEVTYYGDHYLCYVTINVYNK